jgi:hypothetical protein
MWRFPLRGDDFAVSLEFASKPVGVVALLEIEDRADETSSSSVVIEDAIESRALSGRRCTFPCEANFVYCSVLYEDVNRLSLKLVERL